MNGAMGGHDEGESRPPAAGKAVRQARSGDDGANAAVEAVKKGAFDLFKNVLQRKAEEALSK